MENQNNDRPGGHINDPKHGGHGPENGDHGHGGGHFVLPDGLVFRVGAILMVLTVVTVAASRVDFGIFNFVIAMLIATVKASLVALFFMGLKYDKKENAVIFVSSFLFVAIFIIQTGTDLFFRGDVYTGGKLPQPVVVAGAASKLVNPWISTPELVAHGKELYNNNCVTCHGAAGDGKGPAGSALNPPPRNFTAAEGWKNGRKPSGIFKTLREGLTGSAMASYSTLPSDDRWALVHFVSSLGPSQEKDDDASLKLAGIDPTAKPGAEKVAPSIPIEFAIERMAVQE